MNTGRILDNERKDAIEALKRGYISNAVSCLKRADIGDKALKILERGDIDGALTFLENEMEKRFDLIEYMRIRAGIIEDKNIIDTSNKYLKLKACNGRGHIAFNANSPAVITKDQARAFYFTSTSGGNLIVTTHRFDLMEFKSRVPLFKLLGCTVVDDLETLQAYRIPIETSAMNVYDIEEGTALGSVDDPEWVDVADVTPCMILAQLNFSRKAVKLFSPQCNEMLKERVNDAVFNAIDWRMFYGVAASAQSAGLYYHTYLQKVTGTSFTEVTAYEMVKKVNENSAVKEGRFFVLNALLEEKLKQRPYASNGDKRIIENGKLCGEPYIQSEVISNGHLFYGAWSTVAVMLYPREILVDPFSGGGEGSIILKEWQPYDCKARNIKWIAMSDNVD